MALRSTEFSVTLSLVFPWVSLTPVESQLGPYATPLAQPLQIC